MIKLFFIPICFILSLFYSCEQKDNYFNIDPNNKIKFKIHDTLIFNSALRTDTFEISMISDEYFRSDKINYYERLYVYYQKININQSEDSIFVDYSRYYTQSGGDGAYVIWRNLESSTNGYGYYHNNDTTLHIGPFIIKNVISMNAYPTSQTTLHLYNVKRVCYSSIYGILQYEKYNGEVFSLDSNCIIKYIKQ